MSVTGLAIIYIIIWWIVFFAILPIDVNRIKIEKIEGDWQNVIGLPIFPLLSHLKALGCPIFGVRDIE